MPDRSSSASAVIGTTRRPPHNTFVTSALHTSIHSRCHSDSSRVLVPLRGHGLCGREFIQSKSFGLRSVGMSTSSPERTVPTTRSNEPINASSFEIRNRILIFRSAIARQMSSSACCRAKAGTGDGVGGGQPSRICATSPSPATRSLAALSRSQSGTYTMNKNRPPPARVLARGKPDGRLRCPATVGQPAPRLEDHESLC